MDDSILSGSTIEPRAEAVAAVAPALSTTSIALCAAGAVCLLVALGAAGFVYRRHRRFKAASRSLRANIGEPELKAAPQHALVGPSILIKSPTAFEREGTARPPRPISGSGKTLALEAKAGSLSSHSDDQDNASQSAAPSRPPRAVVAPSPVPHAPTTNSGEGSSGSRSGRRPIPSLLIRSLGDLPPSLPSPSPASEPSKAPKMELPRLATLKAPQVEACKDDDVSLTPILNLDFAFSDDGKADASSAVALEDQLDFEIERTSWMSSTLSTAYEGRMSVKPSSRAPSRTSMASSPQKPAPRELPTIGRSRAQSVARSDATTGGASIYHSAASGSGSLTPSQSGKSSSSSRAFTAINMPDHPTRSRQQPCAPEVGSAGDGHLPAPSFRPLSLGLSFGKSASQLSLVSAVFGNMTGLWAERSDLSKSSSSDLELGCSESLSMSRDWSSGGISHTYSDTSFGSDPTSSSSISKATVVPAASLPPLPPFPRHLKRPVEAKPSAAITTASPFPSSTVRQAVSTEATVAAMPALSPAPAPAPIVANTIAPMPSMPMRKRASTFGSSGELSAMLRKDQMAATTKAPAVPAKSHHAGLMQINRAHINESAIVLPMALSEVKQALLRSGPQMPFMSPYHHAVFPDPPSGRRSLDDQGRSPLQLQLAAFAAINNGSGSPKLRFSENLKARLSLSRKSPSLAPKDSSPRLQQLEQFPQLSAGFPFPSQGVKGDGLSSPTLSGFFRPLRPLSRPSTAEDKRLGRSPLASSGDVAHSSASEEMAVVAAKSVVAVTVHEDGASPMSALSGKMATKSEAGDSVSPIMQPDKWAEGAPPSLSSSETRIPARPELHRIDISRLDSISLSTSGSSTAATSPLGEIEARLSMHIGAAAQAVTELPTHTSFDSENIAVGVISEEDGIHSRSASEVSQGSVKSSSVRLSVGSSTSASGAETMSIVSSCATDTIGGEYGEFSLSPASRKAKLLASVKQNMAHDRAKDLAKDRENTKKALVSNALDEMSATIAEEPNVFGLGLYSAEPEECDEETGVEQSRGPRSHRPMTLNLVEKHAKLDNDVVAPLTPPYTPIHAHMLPAGGVTQRQFDQMVQQSGRRKLELVSSFGAKSSGGIVPIGRSRSHADIGAAKDGGNQRSIGTRLSPLTGSPSTPSLPTFASNSGSNTDTPLLHAGYGTSSAKLRPLSLATSSTVVGNASDAGTPILRKLAERAAFSPALNTSALSSPNPNYAAVGRVSMDRASRRFSRNGPPAKGGVLPTVNSSGALQMGRAYHTEFTTSSSKESMLSSNNSFTSFSNGTCSNPSPVRPTYKGLYGGGGNGVRPPSLVASRPAPQPPMGVVAVAEVRTSSDQVLADVLNHIDLASAIGI